MSTTRQHRDLQRRQYRQVQLQKQLLELVVQEKNEEIERLKNQIYPLQLLIEDLKKLAIQQRTEILSLRKNGLYG
jgi:hypothetical protein